MASILTVFVSSRNHLIYTRKNKTKKKTFSINFSVFRLCDVALNPPNIASIIHSPSYNDVAWNAALW